MSTSDPRQTFLLEADELLDQIEEIVLALEHEGGDAEAINRLFRAFHTLKGSGGMFGFDAVAEFTHHVETVLDRLRSGSLAISPRLLALVLAARDEIKVLLETVEERPGARGEQIVADLRSFLDPAPRAQTAEPPGPIPTVAGAPATWRITFVPPADIAAHGLDPMAILNELRALGPCKVEADASGVPVLSDLAPERCHLGWEIELTTSRDLNAIRDVFIFVEDESKLTIEPLPSASSLSAPVDAPATLAARTMPGVPSVPDAGPPVVAEPAPASRGVEPRKKALSKGATVRVPAEKLDHLVNLVGELVMNQSRLAQVAARIDHAELGVPVEGIERLVADLRDTVLGIRMMPVGSTFGRFTRLVHDLGRELGKEVDLVTEGAETELDKNVLDQLGEPLVHLIRNSLDHGIEPPEVRDAAGKPRRGTIRLTAEHEGSQVAITIADDGRGIDAEALRAKAVEKKLIAPDAVLAPHEVYNLIFLPGLSTAKQVTNVSGRGVGMDVVRKQIEMLRGGARVTSERGVGTSIRLTLPLTLAIIDGLLVEVAGDRFILPMSVVAENVELHRGERARQNGRNLVSVRGELVPYLVLRELFECDGEEPEIAKVVLVRHDGQRVGLVVDRVLGSHQTVIQSLGRMFKRVGVVSGGTIMGDGRVALILDIPGLIAAAAQGESARPASMPVTV